MFRSAHDELMQALDAYFETGGAEGGAAIPAGGARASSEEGPGDLVVLTLAADQLWPIASHSARNCTRVILEAPRHTMSK